MSKGSLPGPAGDVRSGRAQADAPGGRLAHRRWRAAPSGGTARSGSAYRLPPALPGLTWLVVVGAVVVAPWAGIGGYWTRQIVLIAIMSSVVSGLNIVFGYAGELAVGQAALYAVGAYVAGYMSVKLGVTDIFLCLAAAIAAVIVVGLISGLPGLRLGGWALAMVTFYLVLLIPDFVNLLPAQTGGAGGLAGIPNPTIFGAQLTGNGLYAVIILVTAAWFILFRNVVKSPYGDRFLVLRQSPVLMSTLGVSVFRIKLLAYVIGAIPAGIAGVFFAFYSTFISPDSFTFTLAITIFAATVIGGSRSIYGAILGAALLIVIPGEFASFNEYATVIFGGFLVLAGVLFTGGLADVARLIGRRLLPGRGNRPEAVAATMSDQALALPAEIPGRELRVESLSKSFGGLRALRDVSLSAAPGSVTAIIGPNGSGKTTLLNVICGYYAPTHGTVRLGDEVLSGRPPHSIARAGVARTFQTPIVPTGMSTQALVATGRTVLSRAGLTQTALRLPRFRKARSADESVVTGLLRALGIDHLAAVDVASLPLGTRRLTETARVLAAAPALCLFDEVASGVDGEDLARLVRVIEGMTRAGATVVLVEHNFPLVLEIADTIHVLSNGELVATGTPSEIAANPRVLQEYVGVAPGAGDDAQPE
jgi:branched-chain amino acid transport system permease protein